MRKYSKILDHILKYWTLRWSLWLTSDTHYSFTCIESEVKISTFFCLFVWLFFCCCFLYNFSPIIFILYISNIFFIQFFIRTHCKSNLLSFFCIMNGLEIFAHSLFKFFITITFIFYCLMIINVLLLCFGFDVGF